MQYEEDDQRLKHSPNTAEPHNASAPADMDADADDQSHGIDMDLDICTSSPVSLVNLPPIVPESGSPQPALAPRSGSALPITTSFSQASDMTPLGSPHLGRHLSPVQLDLPVLSVSDNPSSLDGYTMGNCHDRVMTSPRSFSATAAVSHHGDRIMEIPISPIQAPRQDLPSSHIPGATPFISAQCGIQIPESQFGPAFGGQAWSPKVDHNSGYGESDIQTMSLLAFTEIEYGVVNTPTIENPVTIESLEAFANQDDSWEIIPLQLNRVGTQLQLDDVWQVADISFASLNYFRRTEMSAAIGALTCHLCKFVVFQLPILSQLQSCAETWAEGPEGLLCWGGLFSMPVETVVDLNDPWHRRMAKFGLEHLRKHVQRRNGSFELTERAIRGAVNLVFGPLGRKPSYQSALQLSELKQNWSSEYGFPFLPDRTNGLVEKTQTHYGQSANDSADREPLPSTSSHSSATTKQPGVRKRTIQSLEAGIADSKHLLYSPPNPSSSSGTQNLTKTSRESVAMRKLQYAE